MISLHRLISPLFILWCLSTFTHPSLAQQRRELDKSKVIFTSSDDDLFFTANISVKQFHNRQWVYVNILKTYHYQSRKIISLIKYPTAQPPEKIQFSPDNNLILVQQQKAIYLFNIRSRQVLGRWTNISAWHFTKDKQYLLLTTSKGLLHVISLLNPQKLPPIPLAEKGQQFQPQEISSNLEFWCFQGEKKFILTRKNQIVKKYEGQKATFSNANQLVFTKHINQNTEVYALDLKTLTPAFKLKSNSFHPSSAYSYNTGNSFSPDGNYFILLAKQFGETIYLGIYDTKNFKLVTEFKAQEKLQLAPIPTPYKWVNNNDLILFQENNEGFHLYHPFDKAIPYKGISSKYRILKRIYSNEYNYWGGTNFWNSYVAATNSEQEKGEPFAKLRLVGFSNNEEYAVFENEEYGFAYAFTKEITSNYKSTLFTLSETPPNSNFNESAVADATPPNGYEHALLSGNTTSSNTQGSIFEIKSFQKNETGFNLQFHWANSNNELVDINDWEAFQKEFCDIKIKNGHQDIPLSEVSFDLIENQENKAFVFVVDHSGSMGEERAFMAQEAIKRIFQEKPENYRLGLIKYDHKSITEVPISQNTNFLTRKIAIRGLNNFGGGTALLDAIYEGIQQLSTQENTIEKHLILLTDGIENSSFTNEYEVLTKARQNHIKVSTLAFGENIDETLLQKIAIVTNGSFYHIYNRNHIGSAFKDMMIREDQYHQWTFPNIQNTDKLSVSFKRCSDGKPYSYTYKTPMLHKIPPVDIIAEDTTYTDFTKKPTIGDRKLLHVLFKFDSDKLEIDQDSTLQILLNYLIKYPQTCIELIGHTDAWGADEYNIILSEKRAETVNQWLLNQGIDQNRITALGHGASKPIANNKTQEGRAKNRRTEIKIIACEQIE